ncbi:hypothetical protein [Nocardia nepalensis]|uniref:hypothetical protein n=1 Tax=Nocardia nepalensis TaxID=3375448 RepID=UPI003B6853CB
MTVAAGGGFDIVEGAVFGSDAVTRPSCITAGRTGDVAYCLCPEGELTHIPNLVYIADLQLP